MAGRTASTPTRRAGEAPRGRFIAGSIIQRLLTRAGPSARRGKGRKQIKGGQRECRVCPVRQSFGLRQTTTGPATRGRMRNQTRRGCSAARLRDPLPAPLLRGVVCVSAHQSISCLHRRRRVAPLAIFGIFFGSILPGFRRLRRAPRGDLPAASAPCRVFMPRDAFAVR